MTGRADYRRARQQESLLRIREEQAENERRRSVMPQPEVAPQGDVQRRRLGTDKVTRQLDEAFEAATSALDAVKVASDRERLLDGSRRGDIARRFPAAVTGDMGDPR